MKKVNWDEFWRAGDEVCGGRFPAIIVLSLATGGVLFLGGIVAQKIKESQRKKSS